MRIDGLDIEPIIGLEIHVQLATRTKMFCGCRLEFGAEPNSRTCPVCLGLPGALPVINAQAVEHTLRTALALNCRIAASTKWDRKSYYYPDLPKNYQISQYDLPLASDGFVEFPFDGRISKVRIRRAHLEEDAGKNVHDFPGFSGIDLNRAGTPLLEIVTEPDLRSAEQAREFAVQLQRLVAYLGVSRANMQQGQMRFEPNINLRILRGGEEFFTPIVEVKNLNSFRSLEGAIRYEVQRQLEQWRSDGRTLARGNKYNRGWDDVREITLPQREKEEAHDYRYFPDPDLPPVTIAPARIEALRDDMPELPLCRTERFICEYKLPPRDAPALVDDRATADLLDQAAEAGGDKATLGKQFLSFWAMHANQRGTTIAGLGLPAGHLAELSRMVCDGQINATAAAQVAEILVERLWGPLPAGGARDAERPADEPGCDDRRALAASERSRDRERAESLPAQTRDHQASVIVIADPTPGVPGDCGAGREPASLERPLEIAQRLGLLQSRNEDEIAAWVEQALAANEKAVRDALENPKKLQAARGFLTGQVMKLSGGKADPKLVGEIIAQRLSARQ